MTTTFYRMPPLPAKAELVSQFLSSPHQTEVLLGPTGIPVLVLLLKAEPFGGQEVRLYERFLQLIAQAGVGDVALVETARPYGHVSQHGAVRLQPELWVDLARYEIRRGTQQIPLRAREAELLGILLQQPYCYVKAEILAEAIGSEGTDAPEHPLEQMISQIRRKLGDRPYHPRLIRCKRHAGYALFPDEVAPDALEERQAG